MKPSEPNSLVEHFASLKDPRIVKKNRHKLLDIVVIAICAVICGADEWVSVAGFGRAKEQWFRSFLECVLAHGARGHSRALGSRERPSMDLGCRFSERRQPRSQRICAGELRLAPPYPPPTP
jgi:hypothetical protein